MPSVSAARAAAPPRVRIADLVAAVPAADRRRRAEALAAALALPPSAAPDAVSPAAAALAAVRADLPAAHSGSTAHRRALEALFVAALGHSDPLVRDDAVVLLNVLYDGHMLQAANALPVTVAQVHDEPAVVSLPLALTPGAPTSLRSPAALTVRTYVSTPPAVAVPGAPGARPQADIGVAARQRSLNVDVDRDLGSATVTFPPFEEPGYVDWVVTSSDGADARALQAHRVAGRFVVQRKGARADAVVEVPVDEVGATWDEETGLLRCRGSFDAVVSSLPDIKASGATAVYFMGALERPHHVDGVPSIAGKGGSSSDGIDGGTPFVVARRDAPAKVLGGAPAFQGLVAHARQLGLTPVVDAIDRVSKTRAHRMYSDLHVSTRLSTGGGSVLVPHPGTDARENQWEETSLLNYRDVNTWTASVHEIRTLAEEYGVRGVRIDNAQSAPLMMAVDKAELFRYDTDGELHYSASDRVLGRVVEANVEEGYWSTDACTFRGYPNPYLVKHCRELWADYPDFLIIAESHFHREAQLSASGCIPHSIRVPQIVASINGKSLRRDGSVVRVADSRRSTARTLSRLFKTDRMTMPKNYILLGCTCTHLSTYPALLYGRRSWLAVDFLYFLPLIPMLLFGEDAGRAYRHNMAPVTVENVTEMSPLDVNFDAVLPKSPKKKPRQAVNSPSGGGPPLPFSGGGAAGGGSPPPGSMGMGFPAPGMLPPPLNVGGPRGGNPDADGAGGLFGDGVQVPYEGGSVSPASDVDANGHDPSNPVHGLAKGIGNLATMLNGGSEHVNGHGGVRSGVGQQGNVAMSGMPHAGRPGVAGLAALGNGMNGAANKGKGKKPAGLPRRGSTSSLGLKLTSPKLQATPKSGMVRTMSRDDMRGLSIRNMSFEELKRMDAMESAARAEIGPETGYDLAQIKAHYSHRRLLREEHSVLRGGNFCVLSPDPASKDSVFSFARFNDKDLMLVAANLRDSRDSSQHDNGVSVELDMRVLWEDEIGLPAPFAARFGHLYKFVNLFTGVDYFPGEYFTLEEIVFRKLSLLIPPLGIAVLRVVEVAAPGNGSAIYEEHFGQCMTRLQEVDASNSLKDARENHAIAAIARGAAESLASFGKVVEKVRARLVAEGCDNESVDGILQLCLQRASALLPSIEYEGATAPKDFEAPTGERVSAYLSLLSTVSSSPDLLNTARQLVSRSSKIGPLVFLSAELGRFSTAGGLGVMVDELSQGLAKLGLEVYVVSPYYAVNRKNQPDYLGEGIVWTRNINVDLGTTRVDCGVFEGIENGVNLVFLERKDFFTKVYENPGTAIRHLQCIMLLSLGSLEIFCQKAVRPSLVITNDWLASMAAGYKGFFGDFFNNTSFFHLIHNLGDSTYEGRCYPHIEGDDMGYIHRLPRHVIVDPLWSRVIINPSRTALLCSDNWGTVSPTYMKELLAGHDLSPLLQIARRPFAFPNGIPMAERERILLAKGAPNHAIAKARVQKKYFNMDTPDPTIPLFSFVGRVTSQKGVHLILSLVDELIHYTGGNIQILVGGPANYADPYAAGCARHMQDLRRRHPLCFWAAPEDFFLDGPLVNIGSDFGVMPSAFEPGGIVQQEFFVAGTPVIAFKTGGLRDTVHEWSSDEMEGNGFLFDEYNHQDFVRAMKRALHCFSNPDEYAELRACAYMTTIDVKQVAWAWSSEFHRMRNAIYSRAELLEAEVVERSASEVEAAKEEGVVDKTARSVEISWTAPTEASEEVFIQGSWDGWVAEHKLHPMTDDMTTLGTKLLLPAGSYDYKFRVKGEWVLAEDRPTRESTGAIRATNNVLVVE